MEDIMFTRDASGALHSEIPGAEAFGAVSSSIPVMDINSCKIVHKTLLSHPSENVVRADFVRTKTWATNKGIKEMEEPLYFIEYDSSTKKLSTDITREIWEKVISKPVREINLQGQATNLGVPVAMYLKENKPYCFDMLAKRGSGICSDLKGSSNFIALGIFDKADNFERCAKATKAAMDCWNSMSVFDIMEEYDTKAIPQACRKFLDESGFCSYVNQALTSCLRVISREEDGNNAIIFTDFIKNAIRLLDKRSYDWERKLEGSIKAVQQLVEMGYSSVKVLEYSLRQAFYYGEFEFPYKEIGNLRDYANMMNKLKPDGYDKFPTNLQRAHNVAVANTNMLKSIDSPETLEAFKKAVDAYRYLEGTVKDKDGDYWVLKAPDSPQDLVNEGVALNHCVSSYTSLVCSGAAKVLFLRAATAPDTPLYTVDVSNDKVTEAKGNANTDVPEEIVAVLKAFEKKWKEGKK